MNSQDYPPPSRHDDPEEIFPDVFLIRGDLRLNAFMRFSRNMVVVRNGEDLSVLNSVRMSPEGEAQLDALGNVKHVIRLGYFHGRDDRYYADRYSADFWAPAGSRTDPGPTADQTLTEQTQLPFNGRVFLWQLTRKPEAAVLLPEHGLLITCDALQHYGDRRHTNLLTSVMMRFMGFPLRVLVGPLWKKAMTLEGQSLLPDYERLMQLDFEHLVAGHGSLKRGGAHAAVEEAVRLSYATEVAAAR